jgi:hypothetical protein
MNAIPNGTIGPLSPKKRTLARQLNTKMIDTVHFAKAVGRGIDFVLLRIPLGFAISITALALSSTIILLSMFLCLIYRIIWYLTAAARKERLTKKFEKRKEKIRQQERMRRIALSQRSDRKKLDELSALIRKKMNQRKHELMVNVAVRARMQLQDCKRNLDFDSALGIYQTLADSDAWTINQRLGRQIGLKQTIESL